jgi:diguanylate cyclase (GGDEF)-like protein
MFATTLGLATWMAAQSARNRERQRCELRTLADRLAEAATHDDLTGCLNRRGFYRVLDDETVRARRYGRPLSLLLIDVDHLKLINDENGHAAGDRALLRVVDVLTSVARRSDVVARLGGDEFALLAPETTAAAATRLARRVHGELRRAEADHDVSVSIGVSAVSDGGASFDLMESADDALHAAKRAGRNRTAFASVSSAAPPASRPRADAG